MNESFLTPKEILKLPKWAQSKINVLHMRLSEANAEINHLKDAPESNTIVGFNFSSPGEAPLHYLKNNQLVSFKLNEGAIRIRIHDNKLEVQSDGFTNESLAAFPSASNSLQLAFVNKP